MAELKKSVAYEKGVYSLNICHSNQSPLIFLLKAQHQSLSDHYCHGRRACISVLLIIMGKLIRNACFGTVKHDWT